jgi:hypothetical protein
MLMLLLQALQAAISALHSKPGGAAVLAFGRILAGLARRAAAWSELEAVLDSVPLHQVSGGGAAAPGLAAAGCTDEPLTCLAVLLA